MARPSRKLSRFCLDCDYPLDHLGSQYCPECGRWFDLKDPRTFRAPDPPPHKGDVIVPLVTALIFVACPGFVVARLAVLGFLLAATAFVGLIALHVEYDVGRGGIVAICLIVIAFLGSVCLLAALG